jgi:two-component sensor histidine kinase
MALTHEEVYQSDSVGKVNLKNLLTKILNHVFIHHTSNNLNFYLDIDDVELDINRCIPLGLLTNEIVLNTLKYGFPNNEPGNIYGKLKLKDGIIDFKLWDDGVGVVNPVEVFNSNTLGFVIIKHLASQLKAEVNVLTNIDGFGLEFIFKK